MISLVYLYEHFFDWDRCWLASTLLIYSTSPVLWMSSYIHYNWFSTLWFEQKKVISLTKPITEKAIVDLYHSTRPTSALCIADLGCSSGPNAFLVVSELMEIVHKTCKKLAHQTPEFQVHLNDLPGNDFNTIFRFLPTFQEKMRKRLGRDFGPCYITAVPGSFYGRLFQSKSLHFVHSSYSLMWLSQVI